MSMVTNLQALNWFHLRAQLSALKLEIAGFKNRGGSAYVHIKRAYGLTGSRQRVYEQFQKLVEANRPQVEE